MTEPTNEETAPEFDADPTVNPDNDPDIMSEDQAEQQAEDSGVRDGDAQGDDGQVPLGVLGEGDTDMDHDGQPDDADSHVDVNMAQDGRAHLTTDRERGVEFESEGARLDREQTEAVKAAAEKDRADAAERFGHQQ